MLVAVSKQALLSNLLSSNFLTIVTISPELKSPTLYLNVYFLPGLPDTKLDDFGL